LAPIFVVSTKCIDPWVLEFVVFKHYRQQSMEKLHFVGFLFSWFKHKNRKFYQYDEKYVINGPLTSEAYVSSLNLTNKFFLSGLKMSY